MRTQLKVTGGEKEASFVNLFKSVRNFEMFTTSSLVCIFILMPLGICSGMKEISTAYTDHNVAALFELGYWSTHTLEDGDEFCQYKGYSGLWSPKNISDIRDVQEEWADLRIGKTSKPYDYAVLVKPTSK